MVTLEFKDRQTCELLREAFVVGGNHPKEPKDIDYLRREGNVLNAFDTVGIFTPSGVFVAHGSSLAVDGPTFQVIVKNVQSFIPIAATHKAREVVALVDWLDTLQVK